MAISIANLEQISKLEALTYPDKIRHWAQRNPWEGCAFPNKITVARSDVGLIDGAITRMRTVIVGKPCFGVPTARLLHEHIREVQIVRGTRPVLSRCGGCLARDGCKAVVDARLMRSTEISVAVAAFRGLGGSAALRNDRPRPDPRLLGLYREIIRLLSSDGPYADCNIAAAQSYLEDEVAKRRASHAARQARYRAKQARLDRKAGIISKALADQLRLEAIARAGRCLQYIDSEQAPPQLTRGDRKGLVVFTTHVWKIRRTMQLATGTTPCAYSIAKWIIRNGPTFGTNLDSLRSRIDRALSRIDLLERTQMPGESLRVWPMFTDKDALRYQ